MSVANTISLALLTHQLLHHNVTNGRGLVFAGALIWLTNVMIFGLWYWETDRGGPGMRAAGRDGTPDFLFPQMTDDAIEPHQLASSVHRLPLRLTDQRPGPQPHRHDAALAHGEVASWGSSR